MSTPQKHNYNRRGAWSITPSVGGSAFNPPVSQKQRFEVNLRFWTVQRRNARCALNIHPKDKANIIEYVSMFREFSRVKQMKLIKVFVLSISAQKQGRKETYLNSRNNVA